MISNIKTISLTGIEGSLVEVQTDITGGLPTFEIVGLPDTSVKESKERIKSAIKKLKRRISKQKNNNKLSTSKYKKRRNKLRPTNSNRNTNSSKRNNKQQTRKHNIYRRIIIRWKNKQNKWSITNVYRSNEFRN